jgi:hypothetical protein
VSTVDYQLFAEAAGSNVVTQSVYLSAAWRLSGFTPGLAVSAEANKVWRQSSFMATALATFVSQQLGVDVLDDGNLSGFLANFISALGVTPRPARVVTSSATLNVSALDYFIGLNRTSGVSAMTINLPAAGNGQEFVIDDLSLNSDTAPYTFIMPAGTTVAGGQTEFLSAEKGGSYAFKFYSATNQWMVKVS